jgi:hypothetical protein
MTKPNLNTGKVWSEMDLRDVRDFAPVMTISELADYLCRSEQEVVDKLKELKDLHKLEPEGTSIS